MGLLAEGNVPDGGFVWHHQCGAIDANGMARTLFSLQLMALLKRGFAPAGESLFVSTKSDAKNDPGKPSKAR
ncbi:hypothetical protein [Rheinheimera sp.]|uniref:hypothetical protein n=1 Tax=Rheinheimera sp. TaxID=1869214 RepID=UPI002FDEC225